MSLAQTKKKPKRCPICSCQFVPVRPIQPACMNFECQVAYANSVAKKHADRRKIEERKADKEKKEKLKSLTEYANEAQEAFNAWKRETDLLAGHGCISCGTHKATQWHAGHYRSVKAAKQLRFNPDNVHLQCAQCNCYDAGNIVQYRIRLVRRIGLARVEALENNNDIRRYTIEELKEIKATYKQKLRELKNKCEHK